MGTATNIALVGGATNNSAGKPIVNSYVRFESSTQTAGSEAGTIKFYTPNAGAVAAERMSIKSDGDVVFQRGIFLGGTAGSRLDSYEEGSWTPEVTASTAPTGVLYNFRSGTYVRIGNQVWVRMGVNIANVGTGGSGVISVTGLPFTSRNVGPYQEPTADANGGRWVNAANAGNAYAFVQNSTTKFQFRTMANNADTALDFSQLQGGNAGTGTWFHLQCFYNIN